MTTRKKSSAARRGPGLLRISPEMQRLCALLIEELQQWPDVHSKPMFGFISFYRGESIFAAVPRTRALHTSNSIIFKLPPGSKYRALADKDPQVLTEFTVGAFANWFPLEINDEAALRGALQWLERAYKAAPTSGPGAKKTGSRKRRA